MYELLHNVWEFENTDSYVCVFGVLEIVSSKDNN